MIIVDTRMLKSTSLRGPEAELLRAINTPLAVWLRITRVDFRIAALGTWDLESSDTLLRRDPEPLCLGIEIVLPALGGGLNLGLGHGGSSCE
ncbi:MULTISPECIES: hypothetical protein [unclassified Streptomyces]|uniref:hypothetical protein n=1 Tax=unclassified Streptomyces TaxID=2593676 RepID=UPI0036BB483D